ncbi:MAG: NAD(P)/FAD-dependent oxidoreductase [Pseudomonadales bacterium]|jgi:spermidine dehydrogenase|nr:NAD(P)/FAD-dependent oxidoreductase [Pseudomonadales bacterium]MDP7315304.1 NAD(P)/FAD-dependent oxidoreductase [Pseudomonadales bacterium]|tara:strand:- start:164 stop:2056 length:1893 start_codon:yes stop_codon:yes gene_type:complete
MNKRDRKLGINRSISRRDFINGIGVALSGSLMSCSWSETEMPASPSLLLRDSNVAYPPIRTGLRGNHPGSFEVAHQLQQGKRWDSSKVEDTFERYDLVIVGGGLSGLSAAWFYREIKPDARILILDNHDDFGGHAKRNEFWHGDQMLLSHGGTINIQDFHQYGEAAQRMIRSLGIDPERYTEFIDRDLHRSMGLRNGVFFAEETFGTDRLVPGTGEPTWRDFLEKTPLTEVAREDIARLYETEVDYLAGLTLDEKRERLRHMSYQDFLVDLVGINPESLAILQKDGYWAIGIDALSAWTATGDGAPGTKGLGFRTEAKERLYFRFPDGNASIARLLVRSMIPAAAPGIGMEDVVSARFDYGQLDDRDSAVRIRLESTVVGVRHIGDPETAQEVEITYVRDDRAHRVRAGQTVLACYHSVIPYLCEELPAEQKLALSQSLKAPLVYTSVMIRNWRAFANLGVNRVHCPGCYFNSVRLSTPMSIGDYHHARSPDQPTIVNMYRTPLAPGLTAQEQWKAGRNDLLTTTFETFERNIRNQLGRILSPGGFDPARDIEAITVNRWPHGYAFGQDPETGEIAYMLDEVPFARAPWVVARRPFGRIAIANSDAGANAMSEAAIGQAHRAVMDLAMSD